MCYQMADTLQRMYFEEFAQQFCRKVRYRCDLLKIDRDVFPARLFHRLGYHAAFSEASRTDKHKMIGAAHILTDISYFVNSVSEVIFLNNCSEFKGILCITHFFVTIFFVVMCKSTQILSYDQKFASFCREILFNKSIAHYNRDPSSEVLREVAVYPVTAYGGYCHYFFHATRLFY